jgi:hypothetical protein
MALLIPTILRHDPASRITKIMSALKEVQFHRGLSDVEFDRLYGTEEKCREALFSWR